MKILTSSHFLICLPFVFSFISCRSQTENLTVDEQKITQEKLELFFEQNMSVYEINDIPLPLADLNSSYQHIVIKPFRNTSPDWHAEDSIVYSEKRFNNFKLSKSGKIVEHKETLMNGFFLHRKFIYDENDKLIEIQNVDREWKVSGKINFSYSDNYSKMYKIFSNYKTNSIDTSRYYEFDSIGRIHNFVIYMDGITKNVALSYNEQGLLSSVLQTTNFKQDPANYEIKYEIKYQFNKLGDWIELLMYLEQSNQKGTFYKFVRELKEWIFEQKNL